MPRCIQPTDLHRSSVLPSTNTTPSPNHLAPSGRFGISGKPAPPSWSPTYPTVGLSSGASSTSAPFPARLTPPLVIRTPDNSQCPPPAWVRVCPASKVSRSHQMTPIAVPGTAEITTKLRRARAWNISMAHRTGQARIKRFRLRYGRMWKSAFTSMMRRTRRV